VNGNARARRDLVNLSLIFVMTGLVSATWAARIPATQDRLQLSTGDLSLAILAIEGGALLGLPSGSALVARAGSRRSLQMGYIAYPILLLPIAVVPSLGWLALLLAVWAAANSIIDVAMNAAGVELEARTSRPWLSRLHAGQSAGLLAGGLAATAAAAADLPLPAHFGAVGIGASITGLLAAVRLSAETPTRRSPPFVRPERTLVLLGILAFCGFLIDGAANSWAAVDLRTEHDASATLAAAAYTSLTAAIALVRLGGDSAVSRFGRRRLAEVCGLAATLGAFIVVLAPTATVALTGWTIVGAGIALLAPTVLGAAPGRSTTMAPATAIAAVTTVGYLGSFSGPPLIGALANLANLSIALLLLAAAAGSAALLAPLALPARTAQRGRSPR
jgi:MFS family permease